LNAKFRDKLLDLGDSNNPLLGALIKFFDFDETKPFQSAPKLLINAELYGWPCIDHLKAGKKKKRIPIKLGRPNLQTLGGQCSTIYYY
jgi:hypothetical protein